MIDLTIFSNPHHNLDVLTYHHDTINYAVSGNHLNIAYVGDIDYNTNVNPDQYFLNTIDITV